MGVDVALAARFGVAVEPVTQQLQPADHRLVGQNLVDHLVIDAEQPQKFGEIGCIPFPA